MDEPIEVLRSTKAKYVQETFIMRCKPIPPGTPRTAVFITMRPEDIDPPDLPGAASGRSSAFSNGSKGRPMDEPIEVVKSTKRKYERRTFSMRCKPIPPGTPRTAVFITMRPEDIDPPELPGAAPDERPAPSGESDARGPG